MPQRNLTAAIVLSSVAVFNGAPDTHAQPTSTGPTGHVFQPLGFLTTEFGPRSAAHAISLDGRVVVGESQFYGGNPSSTQAFRYVRDPSGVGGTMAGLGVLDLGGNEQSTAYDLSADGSIVVGDATSSYGGLYTIRPREAFRWIADPSDPSGLSGTMHGLGEFAGSTLRSEAFAVTPNGQYVVGRSLGSFPDYDQWPISPGERPRTESYDAPYLWYPEADQPFGPNGTLDPLYGYRDPTYLSEVVGVDPEGNPLVLGGTEQPTSITGNNFRFQPYRWEAPQPPSRFPTRTPTLPGDPADVGFRGFVNGASSDLSILVGARRVIGRPLLSARNDVYAEATVAFADPDEPTGYRVVGLDPDTNDQQNGIYLKSSQADAVSEDGRIIIGRWRGEFEDGNDYRSVIWIDADPNRRLDPRVLIRALDPDAFEGWNLGRLTDISGDGRTIIGTGTNPEGQVEAYLLNLPGPGDLDGDGQVNQYDLNLVLQNWGQVGSNETVPAWGWNAYGRLDQDELNAVLTHWGGPSSPDLASIPIPEPAFAWMLAGVAGIWLRRRAHRYTDATTSSQ